MKLRFLALSLTLPAAAAALAVACQNTDNVAGVTGVDTSKAARPSGCKFSVSPRAEYIDYGEEKPVVGADPKIRWVRLGLGGNVEPGAEGLADPATTAAFAWQTELDTLASEVMWGTTPDPASWPKENRVRGTTWKTPPGSLNANGEARMHEVYVCGLTPETTYYYRVGGGPAGGEGWSDVHAFTTTPKRSDAKVTIAVAGDSRGQEGNAWQILQRRILAKAPTVQVFSGDMINLGPDQGEWEQWLDRAWRDDAGKLSTLGQVLTLSAHGNHDAHNTLFYGNLVLPQDTAKYPEFAELFYSMDIGPVHLIVVDDFFLSTSGDETAKATITGWLDADLTAANKNRSAVPWLVAVHHHPEFSSSNHGKDKDVLRVRTALVPIWDKHHLDLSITGHDHNYERSKPVRGPSDMPVVVDGEKDGTTYLVCAGSGADAYSSGQSAFTAQSFSYKAGGALGVYGLLTATATELALEGHYLMADGSDPVIDTVTLRK